MSIKQRVVTTYLQAPKASSFDQYTSEWNADGWIVKQISTSPVDIKEGKIKGAYLGVTFLLEKEIQD